jgi:ureidoacrylate peracid hydrolase
MLPEDIRLDPAEVGLLVIDMQNGFCHPDGSRAEFLGPESARKPQESIPHVRRLIDLCREAGAKIWFTRQVHFPDDQGRANRRIPSHLERRGVKPKLCLKGTWDAELIDTIADKVTPDDEVIVKHRASAFYGTPLEAELRIKGIQVLIVTGTTTSFCVDSTIRDAYARDFDVLVPAECVSDTDEDAHRAVLAAVERFHGVVTSVDEITRALGSDRAG